MSEIPDTPIPKTGRHILKYIARDFTGKIIHRLRGFWCQKCQNKWVGRKDVIPAVCPDCKSYQWHLDKVPNVGRPAGKPCE